MRLDDPERVLGMMPVQDINGVEYLPAAVASVCYGTGASNGVQLITTGSR